MIRYLKNSQIDKPRWDECIIEAKNGLVYAQSWFLDIVSPEWEALIEDDYEFLMPLPAKRKLIFSYLIQPRFTQQLGVFSKSEISQEKVQQFVKAIPLKFIWRDINFNNNDINAFSGNNFQFRKNFELSLDMDYKSIFEGYNENTRRNIGKAKNGKVLLEETLLPDDFLERYTLHAKVKPDTITYFQLKKIIQTSLINKSGELIITRDNHGHVTAGAFFIKSDNRLIYLTSFTTDEGQKTSAMFLIIDYMINKNINKPLCFDFEGSMIAGIARFFGGFGAVEKSYIRYIARPYPRKSSEEKEL